MIIEQLLLAPPVTYQRTAAVPAAPVGGAPSEAAPETADEEHGDPHALSSSFSRVHYGELHDNNEDYAKTEGGKDPLTGMLYDKSAKQQILSKWFWYVMSSLSILFLHGLMSLHAGFSRSSLASTSVPSSSRLQDCCSRY